MARHRVYLDIDLEIIKGNARTIIRRCSPCGLIAALKADAYGLGVEKIAAALSDIAAGFGVAELNEALELLKFKRPVQILGDVLAEEIPEAVNAGIILPIGSIQRAREISAEAVKQQKTARCHILIDSGMGRLGLQIADAASAISEISRLPKLELLGIYSHFPNAYLSVDKYTLNQIDLFIRLLDQLAGADITFKSVHIANSDAISNYPQTFAAPFNHVRSGINLYGLNDENVKADFELKNAVSLKTRLLSVRRMPAGARIGYGGDCRLSKPTSVGVISAGYADGLPLALSNRGAVLIRDRLCPVLGRVSMDYTSVSLDAVPDAGCGDEVVCLGGDGENFISFENWAKHKLSNVYDILCSFGSRVERRYL